MRRRAHYKLEIANLEERLRYDRFFSYWLSMRKQMIELVIILTKSYIYIYVYVWRNADDASKKAAKEHIQVYSLRCNIIVITLLYYNLTTSITSMCVTEEPVACDRAGRPASREARAAERAEQEAQVSGCDLTIN